jgi:copper homeostasis protein
MARVEICLCSDDKQLLAENVAKVYQAGAARIELCSAMAQDGLTPDVKAVAIARRAFGQRPGLIVMIRPRTGDFVYNKCEVALMLKQIEQVAHAGADGVVFGALTSNSQSFDLAVLQRLITASRQHNLQIGIHRAFDAVLDRQLAAEQLLALGIDRVLTSGSPWGSSLSAVSGISALLALISVLNEKIEIVIAGGISAGNAKTILEQLSRSSSLLSLHAYSNVLVNHHINSESVTEMVNIKV